MDTSVLARGFGVTVPAWLASELAEVPEQLPTLEDRMRLVNTLAARNFREGTGGPFAALVVDSETGAVMSAGINLVLASGLSSAHAEVVAISLAQSRLGHWDLGAVGDPRRELVVNWRPCAMCYGATLWSGVRTLVVAGDGPELEALTGFDEGPVRDDWDTQFENRGITVVKDVLRDEALAVYADYRQAVREQSLPVYNARGTGDLGL